MSMNVSIPTKLKVMKEECPEFLEQSAVADAYTPGTLKKTSVEDLIPLRNGDILL